jgi:hypothetical protein
MTRKRGSVTRPRLSSTVFEVDTREVATAHVDTSKKKNAKLEISPAGSRLAGWLAAVAGGCLRQTYELEAGSRPNQNAHARPVLRAAWAISPPFAIA